MATAILFAPPTMTDEYAATTPAAPVEAPAVESSPLDVREARTSNPATAAFLNKHGLNWEVHRCPLETLGHRMAEHDPSTGTTPELADVERQRVPGHYAVRRSDSGSILGVVGPKYTPAQNAFVVDALTAAGFLDGRSVHFAGELDTGRVIAVNLGDERRLGDGLKTPTLDLNIRNGHIGQYNLQVRPMVRLPEGGQVALFTASKLVRGWSIRHTRGLPAAVSDLSSMWTKTTALVSEATRAIHELGSVDIGKHEYRAIVLAAMHRTIDGTTENVKARTDKFVAAYDAYIYGGGKEPRTLLDLADSVSAYVDHARPIRAHRGRDQETLRRESALLGTGGKFKDALVAELLEYIKPSHAPTAA